MKKTLFLITILFVVRLSEAQHTFLWDENAKDVLASSKASLAVEKNDYKKFIWLARICQAYLFSTPDSGLPYGEQELEIAQERKSDTLIAVSLSNLGYLYYSLGDYARALTYYQKAQEYAESSDYFLATSLICTNLATLYVDEEDYDHALLNAKRANSLMESHLKHSFGIHSPEDFVHDTVFVYLLAVESLGKVYEKFNNTDSANVYYCLLNDRYLESKYGKMEWAVLPYYLGNISSIRGQYPEAIQYYHTGIALSIIHANNKDLVKNYDGLANTYKNAGVSDSSRSYAMKVLEVSRYAYNPTFKLDALNILTSIYKLRKKVDSLAIYLQLTIATKDSLFSQQKVMRLQSITFNNVLHKQELQQKLSQANLVYRNRLNIYLLFGGLAILAIVAGGLWRRNVYKQRSYALLQKQKQEIDFQKTKVEETLEELKATQAQLVQQEKMASLGELTAGIAHEIQNPLNFVNNFSEVNKELILELKEERNREQGTRNEERENEILNDIEANEEKINSHGKRADAIVKGMIQHSRTSSGQKELTDINALCDEYLKLAYHGLGAKNKSFNAKIETELDQSIGEINIIPQDIGRVILNLINNAFYTVGERQKAEGVGYQPTVAISTKKAGNNVLMSVRDNGNGIPQNIVGKIFQPFFTTKPTGQGTGLGLSLAYDIVKAHGGEIKVETKGNEGSEFIIRLPQS